VQRPRAVARAIANRHLNGGGYHVAPQISPDGRRTALVDGDTVYVYPLP